MNRKLILSLFTLLVLVLGLAACASATPAPQAQPATENAPASDTGSIESSSAPSARPPAGVAGQARARTDSQGAVEFVVTPLNLTAPGETLDFDVSMNTHSVDVSWDLGMTEKLLFHFVAALSRRQRETAYFQAFPQTESEKLFFGGALAAQSVLKTDTGLEVKGASWPVGGGHHYEGKLTFPAKTADGKALLDGATTLTLVIRDADAPERVFSWSLSK